MLVWKDNGNGEHHAFQVDDQEMRHFRSVGQVPPTYEQVREHRDETYGRAAKKYPLRKKG